MECCGEDERDVDARHNQLQQAEQKAVVRAINFLSFKYKIKLLSN